MQDPSAVGLGTTQPHASSLEPRTAALLGPTLEALGYELVRVSVGGSGRRTLQVMMERADRAPISVDHCAEVGHVVSAILDVEDPIPGGYDLEISSPGLDRPLTRLDHFHRFSDFVARVELSTPLDGRKRFKGRIVGVVDGATPVIEMETETGRVALPLGAIRKAKLVLDDALLTAAARWAAEGRSP